MPVLNDLRRAVRLLVRRRTFAAIVVLTLSLAFSLPAVVLSTVDRHFWRPLDLPESDRLFTMQLQLEDGTFSPQSHPEYTQVRDLGDEAFSLACFGQFDFTMVAGGAPARVAVGRILTFPRSGGDRTVVGVVDDMRYRTLTEPAQPLAYLPLAQRVFSPAFLYARSSADPAITLRHLHQVTAALDPGVPLSDIHALSDRVDDALNRWRAPAQLAGILALVTLALTMGGLYGVVTLAVSQRTRELALRVALGARETAVRRMVLAQGLRLVAAGALLGLAAAVPLLMLLASQLYGVAPHDVPTVAASVLALFGAGGLACDLPARRAARLDVAAALRTE